MDDAGAFDDILFAGEASLSVWHHLRRAALGSGRVTVAEVSHSWAELADRAERLSAGLVALGVSPGDRIATISADHMSLIELFFACGRIGAIFVPLSPYLKGAFLSHQIALCDPVAVVADGPGLTAFAGVAPRLPHLRHLFALHEADRGAPGVSGWLGDHYGAAGVDLPDDADGLAPMGIIFTSGTTGMPKACLQSRGFFLKTGAHFADSWFLTPRDHIVTALPLFHNAAFTCGLTASLVSGGSITLFGAFHASTFIAQAGAAGGTVALCMGAMGQMLLAQPERPSDRAHSIRAMLCMPLPVRAAEAMAQRFGILIDTECMGQTECMAIAKTRIDAPRRPGSSGHASRVTEIAILDDQGERLPPHVPGEIAVRPRTSGITFKGYWRDPEGTMAATRSYWHCTGDFGYLDEDGYLFFVDRKSDSMRRRGENISSMQLEAAIAEHPKIQVVAVHAIPSALTEDDVKACVVLRQGETLTPEELFAFFRRTLPYFAIPRYVELMDALPMSLAQKLDKKVLRERGNGPDCWDFEALGLTVDREARRTVG